MQSFFSTLKRRTFLAGELAAYGSNLFGLQDAATPAAETRETPLNSFFSASGGMAPVQGDMADRVAIRQLIDAWAHCADRRMRERQAKLFTEDGLVENYDGDPAMHAPLSVLRGRHELFTALAVLNTFTATTHFNGQSTIVVQGERAFGESYCLAYELIEKSSKRLFELLSIRYLDEFVRQRGHWFFEKRRLIIDWKDEWTPATRRTPGCG